MDPFEVIDQLQREARAAVASCADVVAAVPEPLDRYLDVEERIVYPMLERCGPDGIDERTEGQERHSTLLSLIADTSATERVLGALDAHIDITRARTWPVLRRGLDRGSLDELGEAILEVLATRELADIQLHAPFDEEPRDSDG
jgi:hypothetical protein